MGTNYFVEAPPCVHCGRSDGQVHIGKSGPTFRGYSAENPSPWGEIRSVMEWAGVIFVNDLSIVDEYGDPHTVREFFTRMLAIPTDARRRDFDWMEKHSPLSGDYWLDPQGFSFIGTEFS